MRHDNHECNKRYCDNCRHNKEIGYLCYMRPVKEELPPAGDKVLYVFYDFEPTQTSRHTDAAKQHVIYLVCVQQFCSRCEDEKGVVHCVRCGRRKHTFWQDPGGELLSYLTNHAPGPIRSAL